MKIGKDPESVEMGCPIADLQSIFELKLNSSRVKDFTDLIALSRVVGIPTNLQASNETQKENLELLKMMIIPK